MPTPNEGIAAQFFTYDYESETLYEDFAVINNQQLNVLTQFDRFEATTDGLGPIRNGRSFDEGLSKLFVHASDNGREAGVSIRGFDQDNDDKLSKIEIVSKFAADSVGSIMAPDGAIEIGTLRDDGALGKIMLHLMQRDEDRELKLVKHEVDLTIIADKKFIDMKLVGHNPETDTY